MPTPIPTLPPFKLTAGPLSFKAPTTPATGKVVVYNQGAKPLDVVTTTLHLGGKCGQLSAVPAKFHLAPGTHATVTVTDHVPNADLGAKFSAVITGQRGLGTAGGIAVRFVTGKPVGTAGCITPKAAPLAPIASAGLPWWLFIVVAVVVLAGAVVVIRRIKHRRTA